MKTNIDQFIVLPKGTVLYHGTSIKDRFYDPIGPFWVSDSEEVASVFAKKDRSGGGKPRIYVFELAGDIELLWWESKADIEAWFEERGDEESADMSPQELADAVCNEGYDGWIIPHNYTVGGDIMICEPSSVLNLKRVKKA